LFLELFLIAGKSSETYLNKCNLLVLFSAFAQLLKYQAQIAFNVD
jgi:hypothetical protein